MVGPATSDNVFTHEPLPDPAKYMRLLEVLDDNYNKSTKVRCRLTTWPIDSIPPYHAISYTWGDPKSNTLIVMNDKTLEVRTNCEFVLKQAYWYTKSQSYLYRKRKSRLFRESRSEWYSKSRYFWVDALCIDQTNLREKSKQVAMMGNIYKKASHVLACIGDHADDSLFFFRTLYGLTHHVVQAREMFRPDRYTESRPEDGNKGVSLKFRMLHRYSTTHRFVLALARLAVRPYFTRMWILQELQHAQNLTILCGQYVLSKEDAIYLFEGVSEGLKRFDKEDNGVQLRDAPYELQLHYKFVRRLVNYGMPHPVWHGDWICTLPRQCTATVVMLRQSHMTVTHNIFQMLKDVVFRLQCEDPRDKVYGLISLIDWGDVAPLEPDYTHTDVKVAINFIEAIMKLGETHELGEPVWKYVLIIIKLFNFDIESRGFSEALEARRGCTEDTSVLAATMPFGGSTVQLEQPGWRLSPEDIDRNASKLQGLQATPPWYPLRDSFYLPRWARADDWVIEVETRTAHDIWYGISDVKYQRQPTYIPLLVMREGTKGHCNALIGYGFYSSREGFDPPSFKQESQSDITIDLDIEDAIILFWRMKQLYELAHGDTDWVVDYLGFGVCKQRTPGSSYGTLPPELPARRERVERHTTKDDWWMDRATALFCLKARHFVLFDTQSRRGWLVDGEVAALQLLFAYLKNVPQTAPFDFSRLNHFERGAPTDPHKLLFDLENMRIPIFRVLEDVIEHPEHGESSSDQAKVEKELILNVAADIYRLLLNIDEKLRLPGEYGNRSGWFHKLFASRRNIVVKGWDFERIYRTRTAKIYEHTFVEDPGWLHLMGELRARLIFGCDFGEIIEPCEGYCCPYFETLPKGQDYLAMDFNEVRMKTNRLAGRTEDSKIIARLSLCYAWEHGVDPFGHLHGQGDHLEQVNSRCFPVQRLVKVPMFNKEKDTILLKKSKGRLYSSQDVEDMNMAIDEDTKKAAGNNASNNDKRPQKKGMVVFGNPPDPEQLRRLARANLERSHSFGARDGKRSSQYCAVS